MSIRFFCVRDTSKRLWFSLIKILKRYDFKIKLIEDDSIIKRKNYFAIQILNACYVKLKKTVNSAVMPNITLWKTAKSFKI